MQQAYLWFKVLHLISIMAWMTGLWYLPRLFVYNCIALRDKQEYSCKMLVTMQRKLLFFIMVPAMTLVWISGLTLFFATGTAAPWAHAKILLVLLMTLYNFYLFRCHNGFKKNSPLHSEKIFRILNEVPTLLVILIVILAVLKPYKFS